MRLLGVVMGCSSLQQYSDDSFLCMGGSSVMDAVAVVCCEEVVSEVDGGAVLLKLSKRAT
jgi:hypothetical protein